MQRPNAEEVRAAVDRVAASGAFARAGRLRDFLQFIVGEALAGRADGIKESVVAMEVFHRGSEFDARLDSVVRVEAHKLRERLDSYYKTDGINDAVVIEVPKGGYVPTFRYGLPDKPPVRPRQKWGYWAAGTAAVAILAASLTAWHWRASGVAPLRSLAVLPFTAASGEPTLRELASGLSEDVAAVLAQVATLRVIAQASSQQVRPERENPAKAGARLQADGVATGALHRTATGVRVTIELVETATGAKRYGRVWERDTVALVDLAGEIAADLARQAGHHSPSALPVASSLPVQELYWRARAARRLRSEADLERAIAWYEEAVKREPKFSRAWAGLAEAYTDLAFHRRGIGTAAIPKAREAARGALRLNSREADAHTSLGRISFFYDWDWQSAERSFRDSIEANPNSPSARGEFALALAARRRYDEALKMIDAGVALDPLSTLPAFQRAVILLMGGRYELARTAATQLAERDPAYYAPQALIGTSLAFAGQPAEAVPYYERALEAAPRRGFVLGRLGAALALSGARARASALARELEAGKDVEEFAWVYPAYVFAALGESDKAIACLERAAEGRDPDFVFAAAEPLFRPLESSQRFQVLLGKLGMGAHTGLGE